MLFDFGAYLSLHGYPEFSPHQDSLNQTKSISLPSVPHTSEKATPSSDITNSFDKSTYCHGEAVYYLNNKSIYESVNIHDFIASNIIDQFNKESIQAFFDNIHPDSFNEMTERMLYCIHSKYQKSQTDRIELKIFGSKLSKETQVDYLEFTVTTPHDKSSYRIDRNSSSESLRTFYGSQLLLKSAEEKERIHPDFIDQTPLKNTLEGAVIVNTTSEPLGMHHVSLITPEQIQINNSRDKLVSTLDSIDPWTGFSNFNLSEKSSNTTLINTLIDQVALNWGTLRDTLKILETLENFTTTLNANSFITQGKKFEYIQSTISFLSDPLAAEIPRFLIVESDLEEAELRIAALLHPTSFLSEINNALPEHSKHSIRITAEDLLRLSVNIPTSSIISMSAVSPFYEDTSTILRNFVKLDKLSDKFPDSFAGEHRFERGKNYYAFIAGIVENKNQPMLQVFIPGLTTKLINMTPAQLQELTTNTLPKALPGKGV
jgi:hypothetical protein